MDRSTPPPAPTAAAPVARAFHLERFRDYLALEAGNSHHTVENYLRDITRLAEYAASKGVKVPEQLSAPQLRDFIYFLKDLGLAPTTIRRQISAIRTYFKFLVGEGIAARDPSERIESPKRWRTLPAVLTVPEIDKLLAAPNTDEPLAIRDRALLEFAYATGVRVSELVALKLQDIMFEDGVARVFGKGAKERLVPVGRRALGAVAWLSLSQRARLAAVTGRRLGRHQSDCPACRPDQARDPAYAAAHIRDAPAGGRRRSPRRAGDAGPRRSLDDAALHPRGSGLPPYRP